MYRQALAYRVCRPWINDIISDEPWYVKRVSTNIEDIGYRNAKGNVICRADYFWDREGYIYSQLIFFCALFDDPTALEAVKRMLEKSTVPDPRDSKNKLESGRLNYLQFPL